MKLEDQVVSLELAKKLKQLGFEQESQWYWGYDPIDPNKLSILFRLVEPNALEWYPAYTVAELGEMLPESVKIPGRHYSGDSVANNFWLEVEKEGKDWCYYYFNGEEPYMPNNKFEYYPEADARARILIYLKENKLI